MDPEFRQLFVRERRFRVAAFLIGFVVLTANWTRSDDSVSRPVPQATSEAAPDR